MFVVVLEQEGLSGYQWQSGADRLFPVEQERRRRSPPHSENSRQAYVTVTIVRSFEYKFRVYSRLSNTVVYFFGANSTALNPLVP